MTGSSPQRRFIVRVLLATMVSHLGACKDEPSPAKAEAPDVGRPVLVHRVSAERRVAERSFVGTIRPRVESDLGFRVQGKVARRLVNVGDVVRPGTPLGTLDEIDLRLQTEQAEAELSAAKVGVVQAEADLKRTLTLADKGWSPTSNVDRQQAVTEEARSRFLRSERALVLARNAFSYTSLQADSDGVVTSTMIEPGQVVSPGQPAVRVAHTAEREAVVAIPESVISSARTGSASVTLWSKAGVRYAARLRELAPAADAATRTYLARYSLPDADGAVQLGMTATVTLVDTNTDTVIRVPLPAVIDQGRGPAVWVVEGEDKLALRAVTVAAFEGQDALVSGGLSEGERVVRLGAQKLDAAQRVRVVDALQF